MLNWRTFTGANKQLCNDEPHGNRIKKEKPKAKEKEKRKPRRRGYHATREQTHNVESATRNSKGLRCVSVLCATTFSTSYVGTPINIPSMQNHMNVPTAAGPQQQKLAFII